MSSPRHVVVTRPVGSGRTLARRLIALGYVPLLLPGCRLCAAPEAARARHDLAQALQADVAIFTSPAAVRFAARLLPLAAPTARLVAIGGATRQALLRQGVAAVACPQRADSEGALALDVLTAVQGRRVALVTAPGGRGLLSAALAERGAVLQLAHVYERRAARWDARHLAPLRAAVGPLATLLTSRETLDRLQQQLAADLWAKLVAGTAVCGSERLAAAAADAGFTRRVRARSAISRDLVAALEHAF